MSGIDYMMDWMSGSGESLPATNDTDVDSDLIIMSSSQHPESHPVSLFQQCCSRHDDLADCVLLLLHYWHFPQHPAAVPILIRYKKLHSSTCFSVCISPGYHRGQRVVVWSRHVCIHWFHLLGCLRRKVLPYVRLRD